MSRYVSADDRDGDWNGAVADDTVVAEAWAALREEQEFTDELVASTADLGFTQPVGDGRRISMREVLVHLIEEYARHSGHTDLIRERVDGRVGQPRRMECPAAAAPAARVTPVASLANYPARLEGACMMAPDSALRISSLASKGAGSRAVTPRSVIPTPDSRRPSASAHMPVSIVPAPTTCSVLA